jgi:NADH-quinone oxidoreductase subunit N
VSLDPVLRADAFSLLPEILLGGFAVVILLADAILPGLKRLWIPLSVLAIGLVAFHLPYPGWSQPTSFGGFLDWSPVTLALAEIVLLSAALALLASQAYLRRENLGTGEYAALMLWCTVGMLFLVRAAELLTLFLALELLSFCLYALAAYHRRLTMAVEGAIKYFLMGAFVSAFVLLGIALLYGETGTTRISGVADALAGGDGSTVVATLGFLLLICGFGFKMSLVPFHAWSPDTYQGAPSPFVAFLSVAPKAASALVLVRLLTAIGVSQVGHQWPQLIALLSILSMLGGNLLALVQKDVKRMLAYSGIAHMGYLLIPLVSVGKDSLPPILVYLLAYALMNAGAFAVVALLYSRPGEQHLISELSGWGYRIPFLGVCLTISMLSLAGIPPTVGFLGKYLVFFHAIQHGHLALALVGIAASLVGAVYYLRIVYVLYMKPEVQAPSGVLLDVWGRAAVLVAAAGTLVLGALPGPLLDWLERAIGGN